jgi:predicted Zn-dependent peptidase
MSEAIDINSFENDGKILRSIAIEAYNSWYSQSKRNTQSYLATLCNPVLTQGQISKILKTKKYAYNPSIQQVSKLLYVTEQMHLFNKYVKESQSELAELFALYSHNDNSSLLTERLNKVNDIKNEKFIKKEVKKLVEIEKAVLKNDKLSSHTYLAFIVGMSASLSVTFYLLGNFVDEHNITFASNKSIEKVKSENISKKTKKALQKREVSTESL